MMATEERVDYGKFDFYNEDIKGSYIDEIESDVLKLIHSYFFKKVGRGEREINKDLYDMSFDEIEMILYALRPTTETASYNNVLRIDDYIMWAFDKGYRKSSVNPLDAVNKMEWSKKFVSHYSRTYFTEDEILDMCNALYNYTDKALLLALYEGIGGKGYKELLNLKISDIHERDHNYFVWLYDGEKERIVQISGTLKNYLMAANNENGYTSNNGKSLEKRSFSVYEKSDNVFKKSRRGKQDDALDNFFVLRKMTFFKEFFGNEYLRAKDIRISGILNMANELAGESGNLNRDEQKMIAEQYNTPMIKSSSNYVRNLYDVRKILKVPEFQDMYGYELSFNEK